MLETFGGNTNGQTSGQSKSSSYELASSRIFAAGGAAPRASLTARNLVTLLLLFPMSLCYAPGFAQTGPSVTSAPASPQAQRSPASVASPTAPPGASASARVQPPAAAPVGVEEILVTAQKREQLSQDVPIALTAFSAKDLAFRNITTMDDLGMAVPGMQYGTDWGGQQEIYIRGVGVDDISSSIESPIATYINGVYQTRTFRTDTLGLDNRSNRNSERTTRNLVW